MEEMFGVHCSGISIADFEHVKLTRTPVLDKLFFLPEIPTGYLWSLPEKSIVNGSRFSRMDEEKLVKDSV